jgi:hypothetical protein
VVPNTTFKKGGAKYNLLKRWCQIQPLKKVVPNTTFKKGGAKWIFSLFFIFFSQLICIIHE